MTDDVRARCLANDGSTADQLASNVFDVALCFEGGGYRAAYTAGMVVTLLEQGFYFNDVYGISAGASHSFNYVSRDAQRARISFMGIDGNEKLGGVGSFLRGKGYFNADYMYGGCFRDGFCPFDWETFAANPARVTFQAFERDTGRSAIFTRDDMPDVWHMIDRARASSTIPIAMKPKPLDGVTYYDGGLGKGGGFPVHLAESDGFERALLVATRPAGYRKKPLSASTRQIVRACFARYPRLLEAVLTRNERYNAELDRIAQLEAQGKVLAIRPTTMPISNGTLDTPKLEEAYRLGYAQAQHELPRIREFVGL
ncbi:MAG: patatin family protein [Atopobiaceae bacterium]|nr:patatin family protein [Atopobiaceae bacterium]